jgi:hypothetical protein
MAGVVIHDGRRIGHRKWTVDAIGSGLADGAILSPFATPRVAEPRFPSGADMASAVRDVGGELIFDAMTHALFLPGVNKLDFYDGWELWGSGGPGLQTAAARLEHTERVFRRQRRLGAPLLSPTLQLSSPVDAASQRVLEMARTARGLESGAWQSLVGTRSFWSSGTRLDAYVGTLAALRAPVWVLTLANEIVVDHKPDMTDVDAWAGFSRTVHSLSERSRVIVAHSDLSGLPAVAAGADTVGSGWDRGQRTYDPSSYRTDSDPGIRIPASYVTQGGLLAVMRRDAAEAIDRWNARQAYRLRGGPMPPSDTAQRLHHLGQLRRAVVAVSGQATRRDRVHELRQRYQAAENDFDVLMGALGRTVPVAEKSTWASQPLTVLDAYASAEGL